MVHLEIRNESSRKRIVRRDVLQRIASRVLAGEARKGAYEVSVLFSDDLFIAKLNKQFRNKRGPTDVLSFAQESKAFHGALVLGDIVISLETVERFCAGDAAAMREEVRLLFCHGLLHLLGYAHGRSDDKAVMVDKQAAYLKIQPEVAWRNRAGRKSAPRKASSRGGA
jgi:probable rRNA maturation factor